MRVITGIARGRILKTLSGNDTRPTADHVKEAIFSSIQFDIEGRRVLDLFAGSGQMGIESLSRGAKSAVFIDSNPAACGIINENLTVCGLLEKAKVITRDSILYPLDDVYDIVFIDPPYEKGLIDAALPHVVPVMSDVGIIICEHRLGEVLPESVGGFYVSKQYRHGKIGVTFYRKGQV